MFGLNHIISRQDSSISGGIIQVQFVVFGHLIMGDVYPVVAYDSKWQKVVATSSEKYISIGNCILSSVLLCSF